MSPIHVEYLQNMGVHASMSISLLRRGRLWGLIACHHYAGPHLPPFGTRAAAEFLGSTLSLRLVDQFEEDQLHKRLAAQAVLAKLTAATLGDGESLAAALLGAPDLLDLVPADGVVVHIQGEHRGARIGSAAGGRVRRRRLGARRGRGDRQQRVPVSRDYPTLDLDPQLAAGALALNLPDGQYAIWFRREVLRSVDWGGDPHNKAIAVSEGDEDPAEPAQVVRPVARDRPPTQPTVDAERDRVRRSVATPPGRVAVPSHAGYAARRRDAAAQSAARVDPDARELAAVSALRAGRGRSRRR